MTRPSKISVRTASGEALGKEPLDDTIAWLQCVVDNELAELTEHALVCSQA